MEFSAKKDQGFFTGFNLSFNLHLQTGIICIGLDADPVIIDNGKVCFYFLTLLIGHFYFDILGFQLMGNISGCWGAGRNSPG